MRRLASAAALCVLALVLASAGFAAIGIVVTPATVTLPAVTLNGDDQTPSFTATVVVSGVTQSTGYRVTAYAPTPVSGGNSLTQLTAAAPTLTCSGGGCIAGTNGITGYPLTIGTTSGAATPIYNGTANTAKGTQQAVQVFTVPVHADEFPGTYTTTVTFTVANGP